MKLFRLFARSRQKGEGSIIVSLLVLLALTSGIFYGSQAVQNRSLNLGAKPQAAGCSSYNYYTCEANNHLCKWEGNQCVSSVSSGGTGNTGSGNTGTGGDSGETAPIRCYDYNDDSSRCNDYTSGRCKYCNKESSCISTSLWSSTRCTTSSTQNTCESRTTACVVGSTCRLANGDDGNCHRDGVTGNYTYSCCRPDSGSNTPPNTDNTSCAQGGGRCIIGGDQLQNCLLDGGGHYGSGDPRGCPAGGGYGGLCCKRNWDASAPVPDYENVGCSLNYNQCYYAYPNGGWAGKECDITSGPNSGTKGICAPGIGSQTRCCPRLNKPDQKITIHGLVWRELGRRSENAKVTIKEASSYNTTTNANGEFELNPSFNDLDKDKNGEETLTFEAQGRAINDELFCGEAQETVKLGFAYNVQIGLNRPCSSTNTTNRCVINNLDCQTSKSGDPRANTLSWNLSIPERRDFKVSLFRDSGTSARTKIFDNRDAFASMSFVDSSIPACNVEYNYEISCQPTDQNSSGGSTQSLKCPLSCRGGRSSNAPTATPTVTPTPTATPRPRAGTTTSLGVEINGQQAAYGSWASQSCQLNPQAYNQGMRVDGVFASAVPSARVVSVWRTRDTNASQQMTLRCVKYNCNACTSTVLSGETFADCHPGIDGYKTTDVLGTLTLTPDCVVDCTERGIRGNCSSQRRLNLEEVNLVNDGGSADVIDEDDLQKAITNYRQCEESPTGFGEICFDAKTISFILSHLNESLTEGPPPYNENGD